MSKNKPPKLSTSVMLDAVTSANARGRHGRARPSRIDKRTPDGRILSTEVEPSGFGWDRAVYFHATKGWRSRPITWPRGVVMGKARPRKEL